MQRFGDNWTLIKLDILEKYLKSYTTVMKNKTYFNLIYIDAFCGCGVNEKINSQGSPLIALDYNFDKYIFIDKSVKYINELKNNINKNTNHTNKNILYINKDCNSFIQKISLNRYDRGVIFLDPYGMELSWHSLELIAKTEKLDVWYLFPISGLIRCLKRDRKIHDSICNSITNLLGTENWMSELYQESKQCNMFEEIEYERYNIKDVLNYVRKRLSIIFSGICDQPKILKNSKNSQQYALFFMCSNPKKNVTDLALKLSNYILN